MRYGVRYKWQGEWHRSLQTFATREGATEYAREVMSRGFKVVEVVKTITGR